MGDSSKVRDTRERIGECGEIHSLRGTDKRMNRSSYSCITKLYLSLTYEHASTGEGMIVDS